MSNVKEYIRKIRGSREDFSIQLDSYLTLIEAQLGIDQACEETPEQRIVEELKDSDIPIPTPPKEVKKKK